MRALLLATLLSGCAPAQSILGSYFPSWLLCLVAGVGATMVLRQVLVMAALEGHLLLAPLTYLALAVAIALGLWLLVSGW